MNQSLQKHNLIGLPVETSQGTTLGRVSDFEVDPIEQKIVRYHVRSGKLISGLLRRELLVAAGQVISLTKEKMIVQDLLAKELKTTTDEGPANKATIPISGTT